MDIRLSNAEAEATTLTVEGKTYNIAELVSAFNNGTKVSSTPDAGTIYGIPGISLKEAKHIEGVCADTGEDYGWGFFPVSCLEGKHWGRITFGLEESTRKTLRRFIHEHGITMRGAPAPFYD